ncbi:MAG: hypothetical protein ACRD97_08285 [Nitrososphaeraceae archaeon]
MPLSQEVQDDYQLCLRRPLEYREKVDSISDLFALRGKNRFKSDNCAVYVVGRFQYAPIVMFGVNPGYSRKNNPVEEMEARKSWQHYQNLYYNFFQFFALNEFESPYYTALWHLLSGLTGTNIPKERKWDLFDKYLCNLELIPYHSEGISLPSILTAKQFEYLKNRYKSNIEFIEPYNPKLYIFNGRIWKTLLIKPNLIKEYVKVPVSPEFNIYFFELAGIPSVLFDKFFTKPFLDNRK